MITVEGHLRLVKEVRAPALLEIGSLVLGSDSKSVHIAHIMTVDGNERVSLEKR